MGVLFDMAAFFRWLKEASGSELAERHEILIAFIQKARTENAREEAQYLLRKIEEEMLARMMK
ncbi:hypothetical protein [Pelomicrobium methylotrophicum]|uniref:Uncharacterized protein n=1 Tax=Pelomicrobium methylotrophicum TaxID=2602750 RepID=A0A5C7EIF2_9PROT|nr:hypothetical protein [Pelomicrobium methylotrophicum]TXF11160.1 hypothetical protein FR698_11635 [Pelomicrobium methylotrophicum]